MCTKNTMWRTQDNLIIIIWSWGVRLSSVYIILTSSILAVLFVSPSKITLEKCYVYCPPQLLHEIYTHVHMMINPHSIHNVKGAVSDFWKTLLKMDQTEQHNTLVASSEQEGDLKKDCCKRDVWETLQKRKGQRNITGKRRFMIRQEL